MSTNEPRKRWPIQRGERALVKALLKMAWTSTVEIAALLDGRPGAEEDVTALRAMAARLDGWREGSA